MLEEPQSKMLGRRDVAVLDKTVQVREKKTQQNHGPLRCFEGNAEPHEPFWIWRNAIEGEQESEPEMELYGYISEYSWWEDDITPKKFKDDLYKYGARGPITIR